MGKTEVTNMDIESDGVAAEVEVTDEPHDIIAGEEEVVTEDHTDNDDDHSQFSLLSKIFNILRPLCHSVNLICEMKRSSLNNSDFVKIYNPLSDKYFKFFPTLHLIIFISKGNLFLRLFLEHKKVFKESFVKNINDQLSNPDEYLGIVTVLSAFLSELSATKYELCPGAFDERNYHGDFSDINIRTVLIENEDSKIIYRSRQCYLLVKDSTKCNSCSQLCSSLKHNIDEVNDTLENVIEDIEPHYNIRSCLEVSMEDKQIEDSKQNEQRIINDYGLGLGGNVEVKTEQFDPVPSPQITVDVSLSNGGESMKRNGGGGGPKLSYKSGPKMSYKRLIINAIQDSPNNMLRLSEIYDWILERYPGFSANKNGFQNSIRHNLSLNKVFHKVDPPGGKEGKGSYWKIDLEKLMFEKDNSVREKGTYNNVPAVPKQPNSHSFSVRSIHPGVTPLAPIQQFASEKRQKILLPNAKEQKADKIDLAVARINAKVLAKMKAESDIQASPVEMPVSSPVPLTIPVRSLDSRRILPYPQPPTMTSIIPSSNLVSPTSTNAPSQVFVDPGADQENLSSGQILRQPLQPNPTNLPVKYIVIKRNKT